MAIVDNDHWATFSNCNFLIWLLVALFTGHMRWDHRLGLDEIYLVVPFSVSSGDFFNDFGETFTNECDFLKC